LLATLRGGNLWPHSRFVFPEAFIWERSVRTCLRPHFRETAMPGYVLCPCCNQPLPVTEDDIGLSVTCPRTRKLVAVRASDVLPKTGAGTKPSTTRRVAGAPATANAPTPRKGPPAVPAPAPKRASQTTSPSSPPHPAGRRVVLVGAALMVSSLLATVTVLVIRANRPPGAPADVASEKTRPEPQPAKKDKPNPPTVVAPPAAPPKPPTPPVQPVVESLAQMAVTYRREVVRVNHPRNCVMCHTPSFEETDPVRGAVPDPKQPLPPPTTPAYYLNGGQFVSAGTTYLRQDFSVVLPVLNSGKWSGHQRYDYFVTTRKVDAAPATTTTADSPYRNAVGFAIRELSKRDPDRDADWLTAQKRAAASQPDTRLADVARLVSLQTDPKALIALKASEFSQPLLSSSRDDLEKTIKDMQATYGEAATRTALIAYLDPLTRTGDNTVRGKASSLLITALGTTSDADLPKALRASLAAPPHPERPDPAPPVPNRGAGPASPPKDVRGLPVYSLAKRLDTRKPEELEKQLLGVREIDLETESGSGVGADLISLAEKRKKNGQPYHGTATACEGRADLAGLPFRIGLDSTLAKEKAEALRALSKSLRETVQRCIRGDDPRPNTDLLYEAFLPRDGREDPVGFIRDAKKWTSPEAVPCIQQILAAENRDVRRLGCELLNRIDTVESTETLLRWAVFDTDAEIRAAAVEALRPRTKHDVTQQLLRYVRYPWPRAAEHAAEALVALNCTDAIPQLATFYDLPDPDTPFRVLHAAPAVEVPPGTLTVPFAAKSISTLDAAFTAMFMSLQKVEGAQFDGFVKAAQGTDVDARRKATEGLAHFLGHTDASFRRRAAEGLADLGLDAESVAPALRDAEKDTDAGVRAAARKALDTIQAARVAADLAKLREALIPIVKDLQAKEPEDRVRALYKIAAFGADANMVGEYVIEAMRDNTLAVRKAADDTLAKINPKVSPHVVTILRGKDKREAITALGELGSEAAVTVPLLLRCNENVFLWGGGNPKAGKFYDDLLPVVAKIAPKDKRFADTVLGYVSAPNTKRDRTLREKRLAGVAQLSTIDAKSTEKIAALVTALNDGEAAVAVIKALEGYGADAKPALPALQKLKSSTDEAVRTAAITALAKIGSDPAKP